MKKLMIALGVATTGCMSSDPGIIDEIVPERQLIPPNIVERVPETSPEELKKGPPSPGRIINYRGHGLGYGSHAQHHYHMREVNGHE